MRSLFFQIFCYKTDRWSLLTSVPRGTRREGGRQEKKEEEEQINSQGHGKHPKMDMFIEENETNLRIGKTMALDIFHKNAVNVKYRMLVDHNRKSKRLVECAFM